MIASMATQDEEHLAECHVTMVSSDEFRECEKPLYSLSDAPPWCLTILLALQQLMATIFSDLSVTLMICDAMCTTDHPEVTTKVFSSVLFVAGIGTLCQSILGCRLPIVQGVTAAFAVPTIMYMTGTQPCPASGGFTIGNTTGINTTTEGAILEEPWIPRLQQVQGAVMLAGLFETITGFCGLFGTTKRWLGPLTIGPVIFVLGLSLLKVVLVKCSTMWWISLLTACMIITFSQYLGHVMVPLWFVSCEGKKPKLTKKKTPFFKLFAIALAVLLAWGLCAILTATGALPDKPHIWGFHARTDASTGFTTSSTTWITIPRPLPWGIPAFSLTLILSLICSAFISSIESVGDYHACAEVAHVPPPTSGAINRGIAVEGLAVLIAGLWGCPNGTTSHSPNIAAISISKVASRRVVVVCGVILLLLSLFPVFSAVCVMIPVPVVGGLLLINFSMICGVGISFLKHADLATTRNMLIVGFSIFFGLTSSTFVQNNPRSINLGLETLSEVTRVLMANGMLVTGLVSFFLDNTIPGSLAVRGISPRTKGNTTKYNNDPYKFPGFERLKQWFPFLKKCLIF